MSDLPAVIPEDLILPQPKKDDAVRCKACNHQVTRQRAAIEMEGAHEHTFRNPAGYSFHVACFADAAGCHAEGAPTLAATWFSGYAWSLALCGQCRHHLGWWFVGPESSFVGLIVTRLLRAL